jgi:hypothetical protein
MSIKEQFFGRIFPAISSDDGIFGSWWRRGTVFEPLKMAFFVTDSYVTPASCTSRIPASCHRQSAEGSIIRDLASNGRVKKSADNGRPSR